MKAKNTNKAEVAPAQSGQHTPLESELLAALKQMVSAMWQHFEYHHDGDDDCNYPQMAIDQARAAIAKAEGRE